MSVISVESMTKTFQKGFIPQKVTVLDNLNFEVRSGVVTGFLGGNGAGKTTTMKCLLDLIFPNKGQVRFFDNKQPFFKVRDKVGYLPEHPYFYDYLTGMEFLQFYGELSDLPRPLIKERSLKLLKQVGLTHAKDRLLRAYSKGMLQKIGVAQALIHEPELVILDEPLSGLDPDGRAALSEIIRGISKNGVSIFFSSHLLYDVQTLCQDLVILKDGKVFYQGDLGDFVTQVDVPFQIKLANGDEFVVDSSEALQAKLDEIRKANGEVVECKRLTPTLEDVFTKRALG